MAGSYKQDVYTFGRFSIDIGRRMLSNAAGTPIRLTAKAFDTLACLVTRSGELLDNETLLKIIWPTRVVDENNLRQQISVLRRALECRDGQRYIVTLPGRGYQFVAPVTALPATAASVRATHAAPDGRGRTSIAVLPFLNLTGDSQKEYFGDGMADELINRLTRIPGLRVPARTSSFAYKGRNVHSRDIARDLDVAMILEGSVRSAQRRVRVTAQLVDGTTGFHAWSHTYDRPFEDLFVLEDELVHAIVEAINAHVGGELADATKPVATHDLEAYELYLQGRSIQYRSDPTSLARARDFFQRALVRDPAFARALSALSVTGWAAFAVSQQMDLDQVKRQAERALELDPTLVEAHSMLANVHATQGRFVAAAERFEAITGAPGAEGITHADYASFVLAPAGRFRDALREAERGYRLSPANPAVVILLTRIASAGGLDEQAMAHAQLAIDLGWPEELGALPYVHACRAIRSGRWVEAGAYLAKALPAPWQPAGTAAFRRVFASLQQSCGRASAITALREAQNDMRSVAENPYGEQIVAVCHALLGDADRAFEALDASLACFERENTVGARWEILWSAPMSALRLDARFAAFVTRLGLWEYWERYGPPDGYRLVRGRLGATEHSVALA